MSAAAPLQPAPAAAQPAARGLLQRSCACGSSKQSLGEACDDCRSAGLQRKLAIGTPDDPMEREADRIAGQILSAPAHPAIAAAPLGIQRLTSPPAGKGGPAPASVDRILARPGRPLDTALRHDMEARFGHDFSRVRIHCDRDSAQSARDVDAQAYTVGADIVFGADRFMPQRPEGLRLLAHELTHVVQQERAPPATPTVMRALCQHDGQPAGCSGDGLWRLTYRKTGRKETVPLDRMIVQEGLAKHFDGQWAVQVQTPVNPYKSGEDRGYADGMKVSTDGGLRVEVVEVKSRATDFAGGCNLASHEADGYVSVLRPLGPRVIDISQRLSVVGGLSTVPGKEKAADRRVLRSAGIDLTDDATRDAWKFYNSLQDRLDVTFEAPFPTFEADVNRDGTPGTTYLAGKPVEVDCTTRRGRKGWKARQLEFQVNGEGGVSYGCTDGPCNEEEEEKEKKQAQRKRRAPQREPVAAEPEEQPAARAPGAEEGEGEERLPRTPDVTVPVAAGVGATALTAAAIAAARRRARKIAAEEAARLAAERAAASNVIDLAERRAARTAARAIEEDAARVAGKAAGYAEAAAAVYLVASGRAEPRVGLGPSPLEALYDSLRRSGTPPSDEMRALIESDPVLTQLAEEGGATGDVTPLQQELSRRVLELVRDNPGAFTAEDLEILTQLSNSGAATPETAAELRAAIERARAEASAAGTDAEGTGGVGGPQSGAGDAGSAAGDSGPATAGAARGENAAGSGLGQAVADLGRAYPSLSPEALGSVAASPTPVRRLFDALTSGADGPAATDDFATRFLQIVPPDLADAEADRLIGQIRPAAGESLEQILAAVQSALQPAPGEQQTSGTAPSGESADRQAVDPAQARSLDRTAGTAGKDEEAEGDRMITMLRFAIVDYAGWNALSVNTRVTVGSLAGQGRGTVVGAYVYEKLAGADGSVVRAAAHVEIRVDQPASRLGELWSGTVVSSSVLVADNGAVTSGLGTGETVRGMLQ